MATKKTTKKQTKPVAKKGAKKAPAKKVKVFKQSSSTPSDRTILTRINSLQTNLLALRSDFENFAKLVEGQIAKQNNTFLRWEKYLSAINSANQIASQPPAERAQAVDNGRERE